MLSAAESRNQQRLEQRNQQDQNLFGKFLPQDISFVFGKPLSIGNDDRHVPEPCLLEIVRRIRNTPQNPLPAGPFRYSPDLDSVHHNTNLLSKYNYDLENLLQGNQHTSLFYGHEFRPIDDLESLYGQHDLFPFFQNIHKNGMEYKYKRELTNDEKWPNWRLNSRKEITKARFRRKKNWIRN